MTFGAFPVLMRRVSYIFTPKFKSIPPPKPTSFKKGKRHWSIKEDHLPLYAKGLKLAAANTNSIRKFEG
jgi:hypothetical protein